MTGSEMGHLYYKAALPGPGNFAGGPLPNTGHFYNLTPSNYWSGTEHAALSYTTWRFVFVGGYQVHDFKGSSDDYALAVRDGDVSAPPPCSCSVPA
jgi:hypothetical protein